MTSPQPFGMLASTLFPHVLWAMLATMIGATAGLLAALPAALELALNLKSAKVLSLTLPAPIKDRTAEAIKGDLPPHHQQVTRCFDVLFWLRRLRLQWPLGRRRKARRDPLGSGG